MSVVNQKYWYYINYGSGFVLSTLYNNKLDYSYVLDEEHEGNIHVELEGSFELWNAEFDLLKTRFETTGNTDVEFRIYENGPLSTGTLIWNGVFTAFNKFDNNKSCVEIKDFRLATMAKYIIDVIDESVSIRTAVYELYGDDTHRTDMYCNLLYSGQKISEYAYTTVDIVNGLINYTLSNIGNLAHLDTSDAWAGTAAIDITKLKFFELRAYICDGAGTILAGTPYKMSMKIFFDIFKVLFHAFWYIDDSVSPPHLKFKTPADFITNTLDLVTEFEHKQADYYNFKMNYRKEYFPIHDNNLITGHEDYLTMNSNVTYNRRSTISKAYDKLPVQTLYVHGTTDSLNTDGWFMGYVNTSTNKLETEEGYFSGNTYDNAKLCLANLTRAYYQDYIYTDKINYINCLATATTEPEHIRNFVQLPDVETVLPSIAEFYDGLIYKTDETYNYIARVFKQSTNLLTNITTFESYKFAKEAIV